MSSYDLTNMIRVCKAFGESRAQTVAGRSEVTPSVIIRKIRQQTTRYIYKVILRSLNNSIIFNEHHID